ncbi:MULTISPECIES: hypothetical protein [Streptacidiphilus]|uniref:Uncharacterized protein n=1 Tax=Streptacidiphilus cavernicola TaxID=3342716 RepID=A0ABV6UKU6_9ACTN|nr:hypothetical protein [Streptacidiphilus jeojiense]
MEQDPVSAIERALITLEWVPSPEEASFGAALMLRRDRLEEESVRRGLPLVADLEPLWLTQVLSVQSDLVDELDSQLLPVWRVRLAVSPMLALVLAYMDAARPLLPYAQRLVTAWQEAPPPAPEPAEIRRWAADHGLGAEEAERQLRCNAVLFWEDSQLTQEELAQVARWEFRLMRVSSVLETAVTGGS